MTTTGRRSLGLAAILGAVVSSWCLAQDDKADPPKAKVALPPPKITISKETTFFTEPLRPDGFVDYLEAVNRHFGKGVIAENNANVLLYQAMGPSPEGRRQPDSFFQKMGIAPLPDEGEYFQALGKWAMRQNIGNVNELYDQQSLAGKRPWKKEEFPHIAQWLKDNEKPLQLVADATERSQYFSPLVTGGDDGSLIEVLLPGIQFSREFARALSARAMWELAEGSQVDAWRDLMTTHRLGRLIGQGPTLIEYLVGVAIETIAINGELRFLSETKPSAKMLAMYRKQFERLPPRSSVAEKLSVGERSMFQDCVQRLARGQMKLKEITGLAGGGDESLIERLAEGAVMQSVDWDTLLRSGNKWYDRLVEIGRMKDFRDRSVAITKVEQDLKETVTRNRGPKVLLALLGGKPAITQTMSDVLISLLLPAVNQVTRVEGRIHQLMDNVEIAFALAMWRSEHDSYPESLDELAPKYIAAVPKDLFNGQPLKYERTADGYRFYSVGQNEKDEGGLGFDDDPQGDDLIVRMPIPTKGEKK